MTGSTPRAFIPLALAAVAAIVILVAVLRVDAPTSASDWGGLISASVSIVALGALLTTLTLQREELALQRIEIARLASASQEQSQHAQRHTLIESYRGLDEKIEQLFSAKDFSESLAYCCRADNLRSVVVEMRKFDGALGSVKFRGLGNINKYKFVASSHTFPISFYDLDLYGSDGDSHQGEIGILNFIILYLYETSSMINHIYRLASDLDLLEYARSLIARKTELEPALYIACEFKRLKTVVPFEYCWINPLIEEDEVRSAVDFHLENEIAHYNLATSMLAGKRHSLWMLSPDAEAPVNADILAKYPPLPNEDEEVPF